VAGEQDIAEERGVVRKLNTPEQFAMLKQMRRDGQSLSECALVLGVAESAVESHISRFGSLSERLPLTEIAQAIPPYGFVYVLGARDLVKIGMTRHSIYRRWWQIKVANPWLERPLYVTGPLLGRVIEVERACHKTLKQHRVTGEWFDCPRELAIETVKHVVEKLK
jgi:hypothetical protein